MVRQDDERREKVCLHNERHITHAAKLPHLAHEQSISIVVSPFVFPSFPSRSIKTRKSNSPVGLFQNSSGATSSQANEYNARTNYVDPGFPTGRPLSPVQSDEDTETRLACCLSASTTMGLADIQHSMQEQYLLDLGITTCSLLTSVNLCKHTAVITCCASSKSSSAACSHARAFNARAIALDLGLPIGTPLAAVNPASNMSLAAL